MAKFPWIHEAIHRREVANFIRSYLLTFSLYRQHAYRELLRPYDTRFASFFITLRRVVEEKAALRFVICSKKGKKIEKIILNRNFWESGANVLNICSSIVDVLRMVDDDAPCLGMLYESMDRCTKNISKSTKKCRSKTWGYGRQLIPDGT